MSFKMRTSKPEAGNKYYITKANGGYSDAVQGSPTDSDCDVLSNCVGYAYGRFNEIGGYGYCKYLRPMNAENFIQYMGSSLEVGQTPKLGACMVWQKGATLNGSDGAGHVAIVEKVVSDTEVYTSESGWGSSTPFWNKTRTKGSGNWGQGSAYTFLGFIYNPATAGASTDSGKEATSVSKKIFISPSNQTRNQYAYGNTTEDVQCGKIGEALKTALERCGFEVKLMQYYSMDERVAAADSWGADLYIPVHSNACNGNVTGTRLMSYDTSGSGYKACQAIFKYLAPITPGTSENISANPTLYEIKNPDAPTAYIEVDFHDNAAVAKWIIEHTSDIAEAICHGVCDYFGKTYTATKTSTSSTTNTGTTSAAGTIYRVQLGAFSNKSNADALATKLKAAGFTTYITKVNNLYKVQTGAFSQEANAESMKAKLKAAGYDAFIATGTTTANN